MNCWFCHQYLPTSICESKKCKPYYVTYIFSNKNIDNFDLQRVQFKVGLYSTKLREYFVNYFPHQNKMEVIERITPPIDPDSEAVSMSFTLNPIFKIPYSALTLTPQNAQEKLPLLLTFS